MSLDEETIGAKWLVETFDQQAKRLGVFVSERTLRSPQEAGGAYFDRGLYVLTVIDTYGRRHHETFPEERVADAAHAREYGEVGEIPGAMFQHFMTLFESADAPNPHDIAEAVSGLIDAPKGTRPARTVVGMSFGADTLNEVTTPVQAGAVKGLGLNHLGTVTTL